MTTIEPGSPAPLGATFDGAGTNFAIFSDRAHAMELVLADAHGNITDQLQLTHQTGGIWHAYLPGIQPGQRYGYRAHGQYAPDEGLRFNPYKLLLDPYARELSGGFSWSRGVYDYTLHGTEMRLNKKDSAGLVPWSVVTASRQRGTKPTKQIPWSDTVIYEANVRGYTMRHPELGETDRGRFTGMSHGAVLEYLKALGITTIELMPVFEFIDEAFLGKHGLRNYWGYNSISFFVPAGRLSVQDASAEFRAMVEHIHDAGIEVILDVAYNHTGEGDAFGPSISFRGIDNLSYYRTDHADPGEYINDTGCGNTLNVDHPRVQALIMDSLNYWSSEFGIDGFRFDLGTILGRSSDGFSPDHPLLEAIATDGALSQLKLIVEPWDVGPGGYQLGQFPEPFAEWNDRYRDSVRRFWRGDADEAALLARNLHGSSDLFESSRGEPAASINFVTAHDGFTLADLVSYERKHNEANSEEDRDGHSHNFSCNFGIEGPTEDEDINAQRRKQRLNMLATLLLSQGTPMLLAGDEFGHSQDGNNNAYAQDNETGWLDWSGFDEDPGFTANVRELIHLRRRIQLLGQAKYLHGEETATTGWPDLRWIRQDGNAMTADDWPDTRAFGVILAADGNKPADGRHAVALLLNPLDSSIDFTLPYIDNHLKWLIIFSSENPSPKTIDESSITVGERTVTLLTLLSTKRR